jgi:hypothetical protein
MLLGLPNAQNDGIRCERFGLFRPPLATVRVGHGERGSRFKMLFDRGVVQQDEAPDAERDAQ